MATTYKYRLWCSTDSTWEYVWAEDTDPVPSSCPTDGGHTLDTGKTSITKVVADQGPTNEEGNLIVAPTFENTHGIHPQWVGHLYTATSGSTNIFDELITTEKELRGGWYELMDTNAILGDYIEFAVVDKDDALGLFSTYGLTVGVDVLELQKYVKKEYVNPQNAGAREDFRVGGSFTVYAGLYLRTIYESTGTEDVQFKVLTHAYE